MSNHVTSQLTAMNTSTDTTYKNERRNGVTNISTYIAISHMSLKLLEDMLTHALRTFATGDAKKSQLKYGQYPLPNSDASCSETTRLSQKFYHRNKSKILMSAHFNLR